MNKVQKIKEWISKTQDGLMDSQGNFENPSEEGAFHILSNLDYYIDSLQEEPVSEELEEAIDTYLKSYWGGEKEKQEWPFLKKMAIYFAKWQKEQMMAKAIDAHCFGFQGAALFSFKLPASNYLVGSEVKVIVINED